MRPKIRIIAGIMETTAPFMPNHAKRARMAIAVSGLVIVRIKPVAKSLDNESIPFVSLVSFGLEKKIFMDM